MEVSVREIIREAKNAVNARFDMLEHVLSISVPNSNNSNEVSKLYSIIHQQNDEINSIKTMLYRFNDLVANMMKKFENMEKESRSIVSPLPSLNERMPELYITPKPQLSARSHHDDDEEDSVVKQTCVVEVNKDTEEEHVEEESEEEAVETVEETVEEETVEAVETVEEEAEETVETLEEESEEEAEEGAEEEEGIELEEFDYKGMTLYRDTENKVYRMDEDGALSDPLGLWDEVKQRIKKL
jgi:hypothetical protein